MDAWNEYHRKERRVFKLRNELMTLEIDMLSESNHTGEELAVEYEASQERQDRIKTLNLEELEQLAKEYYDDKNPSDEEILQEKISKERRKNEKLLEEANEIYELVHSVLMELNSTRQQMEAESKQLKEARKRLTEERKKLEGKKNELRDPNEPNRESKKPKCDVCMELYSARTLNSTPLLLGCGHTLCYSCVEKISATKTVRCPSCRDERRYNYVLPKNFALLELCD